MTLSLIGSNKITYEEFEKIPNDGLGHHLVQGVHIVTPAPTTIHQIISNRMNISLSNFVESNDIGIVLSAPLDVKFSERDGYQPDLMFISKNQLNIIKEKRIEGAPQLLIEITSENAGDDYGWKKDLARKYGVMEYWVVDTNYKVVQVFNFNNNAESSETFAITEVLRSSLEIFKDFKLAVKELFP